MDLFAHLVAMRGLYPSIVLCNYCYHDAFVAELFVGTWLDNDDNDTLREVPHPSNEGLALQARV